MEHLEYRCSTVIKSTEHACNMLQHSSEIKTSTVYNIKY